MDLRISRGSQRPLRSYAEARVYWVFLKAGGGIEILSFPRKGAPFFSPDVASNLERITIWPHSPRSAHLNRQGTVSISPEYHRRQAATLTQLAQTTSNPNAAEALLRIAAEHIVRADQAVRTLTPLDKPSGNDRRSQ